MLQEWAVPVIERAIKIALTTTEQIVKKDHALDHDETRMRTAAHSTTRNLTAGMAMITCKEHVQVSHALIAFIIHSLIDSFNSLFIHSLTHFIHFHSLIDSLHSLFIHSFINFIHHSQVSIKKKLEEFMATLGRNLTPVQREAIEMTGTMVARDNVELACAFIQKKAVEKALPEIDKRLKVEFDSRVLARKEGRRYVDPLALNYQSSQMPDAIRLKVGAVPAHQAAVYDEFARIIPGFKVCLEIWHKLVIC